MSKSLLKLSKPLDYVKFDMFGFSENEVEMPVQDTMVAL